MSKEPMQRSKGRDQQEREMVGWLREFFTQFELAWKLLWDERVPLATKLVPLLSVAYLLLPFDFVPDVAIGFGQVDDLVILLVGLRMFISLCPPAIVAQYSRLTHRGDGPEIWEVSEDDIIDLDPEAPRPSEGDNTADLV